MNKLNSILKRYQSTSNRGPMTQPHQEDGLIIATNSHVLIMAPVAHFDPVPTPYSGLTLWPNWKATLPANVFQNPIYTISVPELLNAYPIEHEKNLYINCLDCEGEGEIECSCCGQDTECTKCGGTGDSNELVGDFVDHEDAIAKINGTRFDWTYLKLLADTALLLESPVIACHHSREDAANLFRIQDVDILLMPLFQVADETDPAIIEVAVKVTGKEGLTS